MTLLLDRAFFFLFLCCMILQERMCTLINGTVLNHTALDVVSMNLTGSDKIEV